jgi:hypothetical protein
VAGISLAGSLSACKQAFVLSGPSPLKALRSSSSGRCVDDGGSGSHRYWRSRRYSLIDPDAAWRCWQVTVSCGRELLFSFFVDSGECARRSAAVPFGAVVFIGVTPHSFKICQIGPFGLVCFFMCF